MPREAMEYDVVIVGAGPAGLSAAVRIKQLAEEKDLEINVCVVEKGAEVGSHILSGNVFDPIALNELIPDWKEQGAPLNQPVLDDKMFYLTKDAAVPLPIPSSLNNHGNYIISLGSLVKWLGQKAEDLGVEIYPGFAISEALYGEKGEMLGVATNDMGIGKDGERKHSFERGMELRAPQTFLAEGCRGSVSQDAIEKYSLDADCDPQTYGLGLKEVWEVDPSKITPGSVTHTIGWPVPDRETWMGTFMYHEAPNRVLIGMVTGLDYKNPYISPYEEFQRFKHHPKIKSVLEGGTCVSYGARALNEGGFQSIPKLTFPGGALIGCSAGFLNVAKIKGSHTAMKSGMLAAESFVANFAKEGSTAEGTELADYEPAVKSSWIYEELKAVRNIHPAFHKFGFYGWGAYSLLESFFLKGRGPWTFHSKSKDSERTLEAQDSSAGPPNDSLILGKATAKKIQYRKPDGKISFDLLTNLQRSGTYHDDDQPSHLRVKTGHEKTPSEISLPKYGGPERFFCPAKVYEYVPDESGDLRLQINAQNCLHCKTCSIKMPKEYIKWTVPEGGGGPNYESM